MLSKFYESTAVNLWSTSSDTDQVVEIQKDTFTNYATEMSKNHTIQI